ncbi:unnamed protein product [Closterium sp. NIES-53]
MGLDGGTIISRTDVIRGASWRLASRDSARSTRGGQLSAGDLLGGEERVGVREQRDAAWSACALTGEALREPIVVCQLGRLYNRESVLQLLLWRAGVVAEESHKWRFTRLQDQLHRFAHIRSTKDIVTVRFPSVDHAAHSSRGDSGGGNSDEVENGTNNVSSTCGTDTSPAGVASGAASADALTATAAAGSSSRTGGSSTTRGSGSSGASSSSRNASHWVCTLSGASASSGQPCHRQQWPAVRTGQQSTRGSRAHRAAGHTGQQGTQGSRAHRAAGHTRQQCTRGCYCIFLAIIFMPVPVRMPQCHLSYPPPVPIPSRPSSLPSPFPPIPRPSHSPSSAQLLSPPPLWTCLQHTSAGSGGASGWVVSTCILGDRSGDSSPGS